MKLQRLLIFGLLYMSFATSLAQAADNAATQGPRLGVLLGPDFVSLSTPGSDTKTQFTGGILYEQYFMPQFSVQPELRYTNKSAGTANYDMLTLPVMFKGHIPTGSMFTPNVAVGPDFSFKLSGPNPSKTFLFAMDFGAGVDADITPTAALSFDFRYSLGLIDAISLFDSKPREIALLFGVKFGL
jgi:hypothetical protein